MRDFVLFGSHHLVRCRARTDTVAASVTFEWARSEPLDICFPFYLSIHRCCSTIQFTQSRIVIPSSISSATREKRRIEFAASLRSRFWCLPCVNEVKARGETDEVGILLIMRTTWLNCLGGKEGEVRKRRRRKRASEGGGHRAMPSGGCVGGAGCKLAFKDSRV